MEVVRGEVKGVELSLGDFDAFWVSVCIKFRADFQASLRCRSGDELYDGLVCTQRLAAPIDGDEGKKLVFDLVPLCAAETYEGRSNDPRIIWKLIER